MDTDDLSEEAYVAIIIEAEKLTHDLTLHFGVLSSDCEDETEYIQKSRELAENLLQLNDFDLEDIFWGNPPDKDKLKVTLNKIIKNIEKVSKIPIDKRKYD